MWLISSCLMCYTGFAVMGVEPWETDIRASQLTLSLLLLGVSVPWVYTHPFVPKTEIAQNIQNLVANSRLRAGYSGKSAQRQCGSKIGELFSWNTVMKANIFEFLRDQIN